MENLVEQGLVDTIIVKDLSRFGRNCILIFENVNRFFHPRAKKARLPQWVTGPQPSVYGINGNKLRQKNSKQNKDTGRENCL